MPLMLSGRKVNRDTDEQPTLIDIAVGLSRMPRFAGQTNVWFSVLDHTMFGLYIIEASRLSYQYDIRWWLLHDAHEAVTGDIPTDVKGPDMRGLQTELDYRIFGAFYPTWLRSHTPEAEVRIKDIDNRCLRAEAEVLKGRNIGGAPFKDDVELLRSKMFLPGGPVKPSTGTLGIPPRYNHQEEHPLVVEYVARMIELL